MLLKTLSNAVSFLKTPTVAAPLLGLSVQIAIQSKFNKIGGPNEGADWVQAEKGAILSYYQDHILASRGPQPHHTVNALDSFISSFVIAEDLILDSELVKAMEGGLLRNPETVLAVLNSFFTAYTSHVPLDAASITPRALPEDLFESQFLPQILSNTKSSNKVTRSSNNIFFKTLITPFLHSHAHEAATSLVSLAKEISNPLKNIKSSSPEHRVALCHLLQSLISDNDSLSEVLSTVLDAVVASLAKETNDAALFSSLQTLIAALRPLLFKDVTHQAATAALSRGISDNKATIRRLYLAALGELFWQYSERRETPSEAANALLKSSISGLEAALHNAANTIPGSAIEGWIAVATLKGATRHWKIANAFSAKSTLLQALIVTAPKPSFLLAERAYKKITDPNDEVWLIRAINSVLKDEADMKKVITQLHLR